MAYTYGTPASTTLSETVATSFERLFVQGSDGAIRKGFKKYAQGERRVETYSGTLPTLASGTMTNGAVVGFEYRETNTDEPRVTETQLSWGTIP
jgi:hypothetical protein